jgi:hypothetical protein
MCCACDVYVWHRARTSRGLVRREITAVAREGATGLVVKGGKLLVPQQELLATHLHTTHSADATMRRAHTCSGECSVSCSSRTLR